VSVLGVLFGAGAWGLGGNLLATAVCAAVAVLMRHRIGRGLAGWWARHHGPHAIEQHLTALRQHDEEKRSRM
jgi:hypothetical protein